MTDMQKGVLVCLAVLLFLYGLVALSIPSPARLQAEAENIVKVENIEPPISPDEIQVGGEVMYGEVPGKLITHQHPELTTRDLFEVEWDTERHVRVGMYRGHCIYTDQFRVWWEGHEHDEDDNCTITWMEATEVMGVYLGNQAEVYVLVNENEEDNDAYRICLHRDVDRLDVLDEDNNRIVSLR